MTIKLIDSSQEKILIKNLSFDLPYSSLGIVGLSGSGKTILAKSLLNLLPKKFKREGDILFKQESLLKKNNIKKFLGKELSIIFQNPSSCLNPKMFIGKQISETISHHFPKKTKKEILDETINLLEKVKISHPIKYLTKYPFELSGGEKQKILIAIAISCNPTLVIADEPTTALDPLSKLNIVSLLQELKATFSFNLILISHDFSIIPKLCDNVLVINEGEGIEYGSTVNIVQYPKQKITKILFSNNKNLNYLF